MDRDGISPTRVLVVEDDATVAEVVKRYLEREGFSVETAVNGQDAVERATSSQPDLMVLDIMLPGMDGLEVCRRVRATTSMPVIMLTALGEESDRVVGLDLGADDYITKPFSPRELTARVKSVLRRAKGPLSEAAAELHTPIVAGSLTVDLVSREVWREGERLTLTALEFDLIAFLVTHPRRAFTREELLVQVWGYSFGDASTVTVHVRRLREKVEADPADPRLIKTVWGVGYRIDP
jgi:DNA-binding response OmpR family regulator